MNEHENIREVYEQIHAPEELLGKVMEMKKEKLSFRNGVKYALVAVAALVLTFVAGNGICYAATGEGLFRTVQFLINGEDKTSEMTWTEQDGHMVGSIELDNVSDTKELTLILPESSGSASVSITGSEEENDTIHVSVSIPTEDLEEDASVSISKTTDASEDNDAAETETETDAEAE